MYRSTYYRWKTQVEGSGLEMLRPRERRSQRMPNQLSPVTEERILALAIAHPRLGPWRISASLAQERLRGIIVSHSGVWKVLRRHGLGRRVSRLWLMAGRAAPSGPLVPKIGGLSRDLERYLACHNTEFARTGWLTKGRTPK